MMKCFKVILLLVLVLFIRSSVNAETLYGKVVKVADGDTITILTNDNVKYRIRLIHIDAPEKKQAFGQKSKQYLISLVANKLVKIDYTELDRYKRVLGVVWLQKTNVNLSMVQSGLAWHYKQYSKDESYSDAEQSAKARNMGLWSEKGSVAPWEFRKSKQN